MKDQMKASAYHIKPQEALSAQKKTILDKPLWPWSRMTGFRFVKSVMDEAGIQDILHKCPNGLRHGFWRSCNQQRCSA